MNYMVLVSFVCLAAISLSEAAKKCESAEDCEEGECCVNYTLVTIFGGYCRKLRNEGQSCALVTKVNEEENPKMYHFLCPCKEGLKCVAKREIKIGDYVIKHQPQCVIPGDDTVAPQPGTTDLPDIITTEA